jgi:LemA protein
MDVLVVVLVVAATAVALLGVLLYNRLVTLRNRVEQAWSDVDTELRRRHDLIPNLVETVRGYASHERATFEAVTEARARAAEAGPLAERAQAEDLLSRSLGRLFAVAEQYPQLRADANFRELQIELARTEDRIAAGRQRYNAQVLAYDTARQTIPTNVVAALFRFRDHPYFRIEEPDARDPVQVRF